MHKPHEKIIATIAKATLSSHGFVRKGRSRVWWADHGWWLTQVEFQPSGFNRGTYLNVGAHWLWKTNNTVSFDYGHRLANFVEYKSDAQFKPVVRSYADMAILEDQRLAAMFSSIETAFHSLFAQKLTDIVEEWDRAGWPEYSVGVLAGLIGRGDIARKIFSLLLSNDPNSFFTETVRQRMAALEEGQSAFKRDIAGLVAAKRAALKLPPLGAPSF